MLSDLRRNGLHGQQQPLEMRSQAFGSVALLRGYSFSRLLAELRAVVGTQRGREMT